MKRQSANAPQRRARVLIVDDHEMVRAGLRAMLESDPQLELIGAVANGREALEFVRRESVDLILMDVQMPEMDGLTTAQAIKELAPSVKILIVTMHTNSEYLIEALRVGVVGYILKDATRKELLSAVRQVLRGEAFLNSDLVLQTLRRMANEPRAQPQQTLVEMLTGREIEVLRLLTQGKTNREIAAELVISAGTVKVHVEHIIAKLRVSDRTQAAVRAVELGLHR